MTLVLEIKYPTKEVTNYSCIFYLGELTRGIVTKYVMEDGTTLI